MIAASIKASHHGLFSLFAQRRRIVMNLDRMLIQVRAVPFHVIQIRTGGQMSSHSYVLPPPCSRERTSKLRMFLKTRCM